MNTCSSSSRVARASSSPDERDDERRHPADLRRQLERPVVLALDEVGERRVAVPSVPRLAGALAHRSQVSRERSSRRSRTIRVSDSTEAGGSPVYRRPVTTTADAPAGQRSPPPAATGATGHAAAAPRRPATTGPSPTSRSRAPTIASSATYAPTVRRRIAIRAARTRPTDAGPRRPRPGSRTARASASDPDDEHVGADRPVERRAREPRRVWRRCHRGNDSRECRRPASAFDRGDDGGGNRERPQPGDRRGVPDATTGRSAATSPAGRSCCSPTPARRPGTVRTNPLAYQRDGDRIFIFGSKGGAPGAPRLVPQHRRATRR